MNLANHHHETSGWRDIFRNASITAVLSGLGVVSGVVLDVLILSAYGAGSQTDALFTALTVPLLIATIFSIQFPKILIPIFSDYFSRNDSVTAWDLLSNLLTSIFCALAAICVLGMALAAVMIPLQIPGLESKTVAVAVRLSQMVFWLVLLGGLASILGAVLYAKNRYAVYSSGKLLSNTVTILVVTFGHTQWGIQAVAVGMLLGGVVQLLVLLLALFTHNFKYRWILNPSDPTLRQILTSFRYPLTGHILGESGVILQNFLCSFLGSGSLTMMRYASRIVQAIGGILLGSVVQVTFPLMAKHAAANHLDAQRKTFLDGVRLIAAIGIPVCVWLILAAEPLVVLVFERGEFTWGHAALTAFLIQCMVPDILLGRVVSLTQTLFYSNKDVRTPLVSTIIYTCVHTVFAIVLVGLFGVVGLPIAVSFAALCNATYMIIMLHRRFGPIGWNQMLDFQLRLTAASIMGGLGFVLAMKFTTLTLVSYLTAKILQLALPTASGILLFISGAFLFRLIDIHFLLSVGRRAP